MTIHALPWVFRRLCRPACPACGPSAPNPGKRLKPALPGLGPFALVALVALISGFAGAPGWAANPPDSLSAPSSDTRVATEPTEPEKPVANEGQAHMASQFRAYLRRTYDKAPVIRDVYWAGLNFNSLVDYERSLIPYRAAFLEAVGVPADLRRPTGVSLIGSRLVKTMPEANIYRWLLQIGASGLQSEALVGIPRNRKRPYPVVVGYYGAQGSPEIVFGLNGRSDYHHSFGLQLVREGYAVYVPYTVINLADMKDIDAQGESVGWRLMGMETGLTMRALDLLATRPEFDSNQISAYGISYGGSLALYLGAADPRVKVTIDSGAFFDEPLVFERFYAVKDRARYFILPGTMLNFSMPILPRLIAPRAFYVEYGSDQPYTTKGNFPPVQAIYNRLGIPERAGMAPETGGHQVYLKQSLTFLKTHSPPAP